ncbi:ribosomal protein S16 domain-containing protein [Cubamyces menziesii]|nr:ribosomal protein S16 domain-containing protein [Cubamyces menziesii]
MAVRLRMAVHGVRNNRIFHLVAVNQRQRRNAKPIELLGVYNPRLKPGETTKTVEWSPERIKYWLKVGATPSKTVTKLLQMGGILDPNTSLSPNAAAQRSPPANPETSSEATHVPSSEPSAPSSQPTAA